MSSYFKKPDSDILSRMEVNVRTLIGRPFRRAFVVLIWGSAVVGASQASPITFTTQGVFNDGGTFAGTFVFDPQQPSSPGFVGPFSITSTQGSVFNGFTYFGAANAGDVQVTPASCGVIQFSFAILNQSQLVIAVPGSSFATFNGGPIVNACPTGSAISFEQLFPVTGVFRTVAAGSVSPVPEPGAFVLVLAGLMACGYKRSRMKDQPAAAFARFRRPHRAPVRGSCIASASRNAETQSAQVRCSPMIGGT